MNTANQVKALREAARDRLYAEYGESWRDHDPGGFWGEVTEEERRLMASALHAKNMAPKSGAAWKETGCSRGGGPGARELSTASG